MLRTLSLAAGLLGIALAAWSVEAADSFQLKSTSVDLPDSDRMFPGGSEADAINNNCLACHSADMVLNQPALPKEAWQAEVNKMIKTYKAPVAPEDVAPIVDYLARLQPGK
jgi:hypothetical protein